MDTVPDDDNVRLINFILRILGLAPYKLEKRHEDVHLNIFLTAYNVILVILIAYNTWYSEMDNRNNINYSNKTAIVDVAYDIVDVFANIYVCIVITLSLIRYKKSCAILYAAADLNKDFKKIGIEFDQHRMKLTFIWRILGMILTASLIIFCEIYLEYAAGVVYTPLYMITVFHPKLFAATITTVFGSTIMSIHQKFWCINNLINTLTEYYEVQHLKERPSYFDERYFEKLIMKNMKRISKRYTDIPKNVFIKKYPGSYASKNYNIPEEIRQLRQLHFNAHQIGQEANKIYGIHFLFMSIIYFFGCVVNVYTSVRFYVTNKVYTEYAVSVMWSIIYIFLMFYLVRYCNKATFEASQTKTELYKFLIKVHENDVKVEKELESFILQLFQNPLEFSALGFFKLNSSLIFSFIVGTISNVIYIVQFDKLNFDI